MAVNSTILRPLVKGIITANTQKEILVENGGKFQVSTTWINTMCREMNLTVRRPTSNSNKLPSDWEVQLDLVVMRLALMAIQHPRLCPQLVVNFDHTG